jgi:hypothetical protein
MNTSFTLTNRQPWRGFPVARRRLLWWLLAWVTVLAVCGGTQVANAGKEAPASQVKAAILFKFSNYVEWPAESFAATNSPIVVAILGDAAVAADFVKITAGKTVNGRALILKPVTAADAVTNDCHILFVSTSVKPSAELLTRLQGNSILTVGDGDDFLKQGGAIRLVRREENIRLEINLAAADQSRLKISSKLLSVADVVRGTPK